MLPCCGRACGIVRQAGHVAHPELGRYVCDGIRRNRRRLGQERAQEPGGSQLEGEAYVDDSWQEAVVRWPRTDVLIGEAAYACPTTPPGWEHHVRPSG
jgi:hypothetical protein